MFGSLATALEMPPTFFELLTTFGYKTTDTDGVFQACFSCFQEDICRNPRFKFGNMQRIGAEFVKLTTIRYLL
jgi:hypothetical protein